MLFVYQQSVYYRLHLITIIATGLLLIWVLREESRFRKIEEERPLEKCVIKVPYFDHVMGIQKSTQEAVAKLQQSEEYLRYMRQK